MERLIVLTGAGLTAGSDFFGITTLGLTESFISYYHPDLTDDKDFIKFVYDEFCFWNNLDSNDVKKNLNHINFETILQLVEELFAYIEDIERTHHKSKNLNSVKTTVFSLNKRLIHQIGKVRTPRYKDMFYLFIEKLHNHLIDRIILELTPHNDDASNIGMLGFKDFLNNNFDNSKTIKRIYTLNYDNWLNKFDGYYDGFTSEIFESQKVIEDRDTDCQYNLHGCILWQRHMTCTKLSAPRELKHIQGFDGWTISREALLPSPIISGYNKLTRINSSPFLEIFHSFTSDCLNTDKLLVIGYSFNDPHINNNFKLIKSHVKIVIVVYCHPSSLTEQRSEFYNLTWELQDIFNVQFTTPTIRTGLKHTIDSDDKRVSIFINGIGNTFYEEYNHI